RPKSFDARAATYSNYKKHNTIKVLIDFVSYGDVIMADRGFNVSDELALRGAHLEIPAFTKGKKQLSGMEVERSRQFA
uniref:DDE Tnp4 domain-containing protein n=1 Tax=Amphimedon queenslandica TaxID=400682 RepID=A0A1X7URN3_AMPQE